MMSSFIIIFFSIIVVTYFLTVSVAMRIMENEKKPVKKLANINILMSILFGILTIIFIFFVRTNGSSPWQILALVSVIVSLFINISIAKYPTESGLNANIIIFSILAFSSIGIALLQSPLIKMLPSI